MKALIKYKSCSGLSTFANEHVLENLGIPSALLNPRIKQVQFRTGQTDALLPMLIVREHSESINPSARLSLSSDCRGPTDVLLQKRKKEMRNPSLGGTDSFSILLTATVLKNLTVKNMTIQSSGSWWSL